jgi:hypothetical protein
MDFKLDPTADIAGTSWAADIEVAPADVLRTFGPANRQTDPYKVSACYSFTDGSRVFTLYDWKSTALYNRDLPSPLKFWNSHEQTTLSIGGRHEGAEDFKAWLLEKVSHKK